jgi:hypothetical protein
MSRTYDIRVEITGFEKRKILKIKRATNELWDFDWEYANERSPNQCETLVGNGVDSLCDGMSDSEFSKHLTKKIFEANGQGCNVHISTTELDVNPSVYEFDEDSKLD